MDVFKRMNVWKCIVFFGTCCVSAQNLSGDCVRYYLCDLGGTIIRDGSPAIIARKSVQCDDPLDIWCAFPVAEQNRSAPKTPKETPILSLPPTPTAATVPPEIPTEIDIPARTCGFRRELPNAPLSVSQNKANPRATHYAEFPWMIALLIQNNPSNPNQYSLKCGASLVHPKGVLTAAHCVNKIDKSILKVRAGEWDIESETEPLPHQDRNVQEVHIHPEFNVSNLQNDIAVIVVDSAFKLGGNVDIICLPLQGEIFDRSSCVFAGWGKDKLGDRAFKRIMRKIDLTLISTEDCQNQFSHTAVGRYFLLDRSFICTSGEGGKDTCKGDGGGPLVCPKPQNPDRWTQVGVVSWGLECGDGNPSVFSKVPIFVNWIISHIPYTD